MTRNSIRSFIKPFLVLFAVVVSLSIISILRSRETSNNVPKEDAPIITSVVSTCPSAEEIDYYYYEDKVPDWQNNKFGLYVYAEEKGFFELAQTLVNSNGGEWGYVLIPYNIRDRDDDKWARVFQQLRQKQLIPIIQLHITDLDDYKKVTREAARFLNRFLWPIKPHYVSIYNEPNDANFWFGKVDPREFARLTNYTLNVFKEENADFYMLNGALNISASSDAKHMDAFEFLYEMNQEVPGIFDKLDGWASHSYPQPNFSGSPFDKGRWSIRAYEYELDYLKNVIGVAKDLPVFITETGWAHAEGDSYNGSFLSDGQVSEFFKIAYEEVWLKDDRVRAVTPFTIWYAPPYDHFSWVNKDRVPYKHFEVVKSMKKEKGDPPKLLQGKVSC